MSHKSDAKLKEGMFDGPKFRTLFRDQEFVTTMNDKEKAAWFRFKDVSTKFLDNTKDADYIQEHCSQYDKELPRLRLFNEFKVAFSRFTPR